MTENRFDRSAIDLDKDASSQFGAGVGQCGSDGSRDERTAIRSDEPLYFGGFEQGAHRRERRQGPSWVVHLIGDSSTTVARLVMAEG